jgi:ceramide glucosyltransferase
MPLPVASIVFFCLSALGFVGTMAALASLAAARRRRIGEPSAFLGVSIIKPLCGLDDELEKNLESHLDLDYPGPWEILLGVRSEADPAWPIARAFAQAHPERVRVVLQEGEPGHNPKVNQLITLTRAARHEVIVANDSNVSVYRRYLKELVAVLEEPGVGLSTNLIGGVGEQRLGAVVDNMTLACFVTPMLAGASVVLRMSHNIMGKSLAIRRTTLESIGGWHAVKDVLAEDQRLGVALRDAGLHTALCPTPIQNVQVTQDVRAFFGRQSRWALIRFRIGYPFVLLEPLTLFPLFALGGALSAPGSALAWGLFLFASAGMIGAVQVGALLVRGHLFALRHVPLIPLRDFLFLAAWLRGATMRWVTWRGNRLLVLARTRLAEPEAMERVRNLQRR